MVTFFYIKTISTNAVTSKSHTPGLDLMESALFKLLRQMHQSLRKGLFGLWGVLQCSPTWQSLVHVSFLLSCPQKLIRNGREPLPASGCDLPLTRGSPPNLASFRLLWTSTPRIPELT
uniref:Uncharacterized protein n=1 Tax=Micrurus surinamensis TaxID=129470 RepID=A0A2D4PRH4_MICSU